VGGGGGREGENKRNKNGLTVFGEQRKNKLKRGELKGKKKQTHGEKNVGKGWGLGGKKLKMPAKRSEGN